MSNLQLDEEQKKLVEDNLPLVYRVAYGLGIRPDQPDYDDQIQDGRMGLIVAATRFDPSRNVEFGAFARFFVMGSIMDSARNNSWLKRAGRMFLKS